MVKHTSNSQKDSVMPSKSQAIIERGRHFSTISISNYRCFKEFTINSLERINLIGGKNNIGKSTLLEALFLLLGATNVGLILNINAFRGMENFQGEANSIRDVLWKHLFHNLDDQAAITIKSDLGIGKSISVVLKQVPETSTLLSTTKSPQSGNFDVPSHSLQLQYMNVTGKSYKVNLHVTNKGISIPPPSLEPLLPGIFVASRRHFSLQEIAIRYGPLEERGISSELVTALKCIEPRLNRISIIVSASGPMLYGDIGLGQMVPFSVMGDGLGNMASILLAISSTPGGIVLVDEIENGLHYSTLSDVWKAIAETARRYDTQVFATTHSFECIEAANNAFKDNGQFDFRYHRLQKVNDTIEAVTFDESSLDTVIERGWEIR